MRRALGCAALAAAMLTGCKPWTDEDLTAVATDQSWAALSAGGQGSCALNAAGEAWCWGVMTTGSISPLDWCDEPIPPGYDNSYPLGAYCQQRPVPVSGGHRFVSLETQGSITLAVDQAGTMWGWGSNSTGQLGIGAADTDYPRQVRGLEGRRFRSVSVGNNAACGVTQEGGIVCWGAEGLITTDHYNCTVQGCAVAPVDIAGTNWEQVVVGGFHACARAASGQVSCWGYGPDGALGSTPLASCPTNQGFPVSCRTTPTPVAGSLAFTRIAATGQATCGITAAGGVYCWGKGIHGPGVIATPALALSPTTGWTAVDGSRGMQNAFCAVRTDGSLWCFGYSQIGSPSPHQVVVSEPVTDVSVGSAHVCAWTNAGAAWCFGEQWTGALGTGTHSLLWQATPLRVGAPWRD